MKIIINLVRRDLDPLKDMLYSVTQTSMKNSKGVQ